MGFQGKERIGVVQEWTHDLTLMQQSVLLTSVRGPDGIPKYHPVKFLLRWYRRCILKSSFMGRVVDNPYDEDGGSFLGPSYKVEIDVDGKRLARDWRLEMNERVSDYLRAADELPHHFQMHFMHSAEILGYKHPDELIREWWNYTYERLVHDLHLFPETEAQMDRRLGDDREHWLERNDVATVA